MFRIFGQLGWFIREMKWRYVLAFSTLFVSDVFSLLVPWITGFMIDQMTMHTLTFDILLYVAIGMVIIIVVGYFFSVIWNFIFIHNANLLEFKLRRRFFNHIISLDGKFFKKYLTGDLMSRATEDIQAMNEAIDFGLFMLAEASLYLVLLLGCMLFINWQLTLIILIPVVIVPFVVYRLEVLAEKYYEERQQATSRLSNSVLESIVGIRVVRAYAQEQADLAKLNAGAETAYHANNKFNKLISLYGPVFTIIFAVILTIAFTLGLINVFQGNMTPGTLVTYLVYVRMLEWPLFALGAFANVLQRGSGSYTRLDAVYNETSDIHEPVAPLALPAIESISFKHYAFEYPRAHQLTLHDLSFEISRGQTLGIVGTTGAGKTTILRQLLLQYKVGNGGIQINGHDITEYSPYDVRRHIAYVPQEHIVFSKTVYQNILLGKPNATEAEVMQAIEHADFTKDIGTLSHGLETVTGESGVMLSGGQKQRLSLARAFVRDADVLILDDSLSAVDGKTEKNIISNIMEYYKDTIKIIVAHRLSAVQHADKIVVISDGTVVETGTHDELMRIPNGWYHTQFTEQNTMDVDQES